VNNIKFETLIKTNYTLDSEQIEQFKSLSPFHKRLFIKQARQALSELIEEKLESDKIEVFITVTE
jgi:hypothetical protein